MCAALAGEPAQARRADQCGAAARHRARRSTCCSREKVVGAGAEGRHAVTIEWAGVDRLTAWRFGLATATGVAVPDDADRDRRPAGALWHALSPADPAGAARGGRRGGGGAGRAVERGAGRSVRRGRRSRRYRPARRARSRATCAPPMPAASAPDRLSALQAAVGRAEDRARHYARLVLTARAAARIAPADGARRGRPAGRVDADRRARPRCAALAPAR